MQARLTPDIDQVRYCALGALGGFDTLDAETAVECAKSELNALLRYIDAFDGGAIPISIIEGVVVINETT